MAVKEKQGYGQRCKHFQHPTDAIIDPIRPASTWPLSDHRIGLADVGSVRRGPIGFSKFNFSTFFEISVLGVSLNFCEN